LGLFATGFFTTGVAEGMADSDGSGGGDGERDHEGRAGALEGNLMPGEGKRAQRGDEGGNSGEYGNFDEDLRAGGSAEAEELADVLELDVA
jgi:hypothetical protein